MRRIPVLITAVLLATGPAAAQQTDPGRLDVAGLVADASTGEPLAGAAISIEGTALRTLTNDDGRFVLRGVPAGEQTWVIERLGYATWRQPLTVAHLDQLRIGLMARPVALEAIRVTVDRLEARRKLAPYSVYGVSREVLRSSAAIDALDLARSRMHWLPAGCPSGGGGTPAPAGTVPDESSLRDPGQKTPLGLELCIRYRGGVRQPGICLDERPISHVVLTAYGADEIYAIDYVGGPAPQIRLYTERFLESGRPVRPLTFGCR